MTDIEKQCHGLFLFLQQEYPLKQRINVHYHDCEILFLDNLETWGNTLCTKGRMDIHIATAAPMFDVFMILAHEYKHCIQHSDGSWPKGLLFIPTDSPLEVEAEKFAGAEVLRYIESWHTLVEPDMLSSIIRRFKCLHLPAAA